MAFPYAERDYSLYSGSTNEGSVSGAHHDLDRCAQILNEVLDNGAGILEGVKKRKSPSSPGKELANIELKKVRQTNIRRRFPTNISSSTPQARRQRSLSASCTSSGYHSKPSDKRPRRSLSEQRNPSIVDLRNGREGTGSSSRWRRPIVMRSAKQCHNSQLDNQSVTSDADTLTGVHLDDSSQFGVPPVFHTKGRKYHKVSKTAKRDGHNKMGWLKPQASVCTQTPASDKENQPKTKSKLQRKSRDAKGASDKTLRSCRLRTQPLPTPEAASRMSGAITKTRQQKENDVDDLLEQTLTSEDVPTQVQVENVNTRKGTSNQAIVALLMARLKTAAQTDDVSTFDRALRQVSLTVNKMVTDNSPKQTGVDKLLLPFQRETKALREEIAELKERLSGSHDYKCASAHLTEQDVAAEAHNAQISRHHVTPGLTQLEVARGDNYLPPCHAGETRKLELVSSRLSTLQATVRLFHTKISDVSTRCNTEIATELNSVLQLCSHALIDSMDSAMDPVILQANQNKSKWERKPENLADVVCSNLIESRAKERERSDDYILTEQPLRQYYTGSLPAHHSSTWSAKQCFLSDEDTSSEQEPLNSTLRSDADSTLNEQSSVSTLSLATTVADNVFQDGLAQLDANIAKLQASLRSSRFSSSL